MKYFYKELSLDVPDSVYYPKEDSELLAKAIKKFSIKNKKCLDIGCGSGFLAILLEKQCGIVTAVDINKEAVIATEKNAKMNGVNVNAIQSDLFESINEKFDLIVFNPPYLPTEKNEKDETYSGRKTRRELIERFVKDVRKYLKDKGKILMIISSLTGEKEVINLFERNGFSTTVIARQKIPWEELIVIEARKSI